MKEIRYLVQNLKIPKITLPPVIVIGKWKPLAEFARQLWRIDIQGISEHANIKQIHIVLSPKSEQQEKQHITVNANQKEARFEKDRFDQISGFVSLTLKGVDDKVPVTLQYRGPAEVQTTYKLIPTALSSSAHAVEQHAKDLSSPVVFVSFSSAMTELPHLNWRIHYIGVVFAKCQVQELKELGLYYQRRYKFKWIVVGTQQFPNVPEFLVTQKVLVGVQNIEKEVRQVLLKPVKRKLEQIKREYSQKKLEHEQELKTLGRQIPETEEGKMFFVWNLIFSFSEKYCEQIKGNIHLSETSTYAGGIVLKALFRHLYSEFLSSPILSDIQNSTLQKMIKMYQNDSIPGFPSIESFKYVLTPHLYKLKQPAIDLVKDTYNYLRVIYSQVIRQQMGPYGTELVDEVLDTVDEFMQGLCQNTLQMVLGNIESQLQIVMSNNHQYNKKHSDLVPKQAGSLDENRNRQNSITTRDRKEDKNAAQRQNTIVTEFRNRIQSYYKLVISVLRDIIPKNIGYFLIMQSKKGMQLQVYRKLLEKRELVINIRQSVESVERRNELLAQIKNIKEKINLIMLEESKIL